MIGVKMTREEHIAFLNDDANIRKCDGCPENIHSDNWQDRLPCGQYRCWVAIHATIPERSTHEDRG